MTLKMDASLVATQTDGEACHAQPRLDGGRASRPSGRNEGRLSRTARVALLGWPLVHAFIVPGTDAFAHGPGLHRAVFMQRGADFRPSRESLGAGAQWLSRDAKQRRHASEARVSLTRGSAASSGAARGFVQRRLAAPANTVGRFGAAEGGGEGGVRGRGKAEEDAAAWREVKGMLPGADPSSAEFQSLVRIESHLRRSQLRALYFSQFLSGFGDRVWQFAIPFFLLALHRPDSMKFAVIYALVTGFTNIAGGPVVSYGVEKFGRLNTITACMLVQTVFVTLSFLITYAALSLSAEWVGTLGFLMILLTASCSIGSLASFGSTFAIERDWIRCLNKGVAEYVAQSERVLRAISIACRVAAPVFVAVILSSLSASLAALSIALWDLVAVMIEYSILRSIYVTNPRLAAPKERRAPPPGALLSPTQTLVRVRGRQRWLLAYRASWREYLDIDRDGAAPALLEWLKLPRPSRMAQACSSATAPALTHAPAAERPARPAPPDFAAGVASLAGLITRPELAYAVRSGLAVSRARPCRLRPRAARGADAVRGPAGVLRCWDLWIGCICGAALFVYIRRILALPYA